MGGHRYLCIVISALISIVALGGCGMSYLTPGAAADLSAFGLANYQSVKGQTDAAIQRRLELKPLATFPVHLAVARVQGAGYRSYSTEGYASGNYSVVVDRDIETAQDIDSLKALPMIDGVVPINRLLLPRKLDTERDLRAAAAAVHADMMLVYTVDTRFQTDKWLQPLGILTLGLFPDRSAKVRTTCSAVLVDTRNGYLYGAAEATAKRDSLTNAWNTESAVESTRIKAEREAFQSLVENFCAAWPQVVQEYHTNKTQDPPAPPAHGSGTGEAVASTLAPG